MSRRSCLLLAATLAPLLAPATALAKPEVKAELLCGVVAGEQVVTVVPTADGRRLDQPVTCAVHISSARNTVELSAAAFTDAPGRARNDPHTDNISADQDFEFTLTPSGPGVDAAHSDFDPCASFSITAHIDQDGAQIWKQTVKVVQTCPAPAQPTPAAKPASEGDWAPDQLSSLPDDDARGLAESFRAAIVDEDAETFVGMIPKDGVKVAGKSLSQAKAKALFAKGGYEALTGRAKECGEDATGVTCAWTSWKVLDSSAKAFSIYSGPDYGKIKVDTFAKTKAGWRWTGMVVKDVGSP